ncbi:MAG: ATP-binding protein [Bacillota bacterium]
MKCLKTYNNVIPSNINNVRTVIDDLICNLCDCLNGGLNDSVIFDLKVVLNEMIINAIRHGNKEDENKSVKIKAGIAVNKNLFIIIEDEGSGYNFKDICDRCKSYDETVDVLETKDCGRGIMIVRGLCDRVKVNAKGNKIVILKRINETH